MTFETFDTDQLISNIIEALDNVEVAHTENWSRLAFAITGLKQLKEGINEHEKKNNEHLKRLLDRIETLSEGEVKNYGLDEIQWSGTPDQLDNGSGES